MRCAGYMDMRVLAKLGGAAALLGITVTASTVAAQQAVVPLRLEDAFALNEFLVNGGAPAFSPDGAQLAYVLCDQKRRAAVPDEQATVHVATRGAAMYTLGCDIWVTATTGGNPQNISEAIGNNWAPAWSPDGRQIAFYSDRDGAPYLWLWEASTGAVRKVSEARVRTTVGTQRPIWLPDAKHLIARLLPEGVTDAELDEDSAAPPKARTADDKTNHATVVVYESGQPAKEPDGSARTRTDAPPKPMMADLGVVSVANGEVKRIVKGIHSQNAWLSPDGASLLYPVWKGGPTAGTFVSPFDFAVADVETGRSRTVVSNVMQAGGTAVSWSPDGEWIAYFDSKGLPPKEENLETGPGAIAWGHLHVVAATGGAPKRLEPSEAMSGFDASDSRPLWSAESDAVYVIGDNRVWRGVPAEGRVTPLTAETHLELAALVSMGGGNQVWAPGDAAVVVMARNLETIQTGMVRVGVVGALSPGIEEPKKYAFRDAAPLASADGRLVVYTAESADVPAEIWLTTADFSPPTRLTHANPQLEKYALGEARLVEYRSADGEPLKATLLLPAGYEPGKRYPMITVVYASGNGSRFLTYFGLTNYGQYNYHLLTTRGYAVLSPDIPVNVGTPVRDLMKAVMPAIDKVIEMGIADPDRLGVTGQSNGGYSTLSLIVQTHRFKAAVMNAGFGDLTGFYGAMSPDGTGSWHPWLEQKGGAMGVPPWEDPQRYVENSPIYYLDRIETPLIIQAGADDKAIVPFSDQVFVGLKRLNKNVIYLRYKDESHLLERHANKIDYWNRVFEFWDRHLQASESANP